MLISFELSFNDGRNHSKSERSVGEKSDEKSVCLQFSDFVCPSRLNVSVEKLRLRMWVFSGPKNAKLIVQLSAIFGWHSRDSMLYSAIVAVVMVHLVLFVWIRTTWEDGKPSEKID